MNAPLVLIPLGPGEYIALEPDQSAQARDRAREILGAGWAGSNAAAVTTQSPENLLTAEATQERTAAPASWF